VHKLQALYQGSKRTLLPKRWQVETRLDVNQHCPPLPELGGFSRHQLFNFVTSACVEDAPRQEMYNYASHDFERFVRTVGLVEGLSGCCLELGANPYFTTLLLSEFTELDLTLANFFSETHPDQATQKVRYLSAKDCINQEKSFDFHHFNVESSDFPFKTGPFDVVIFAEIIEHLLNDPCAVIREIKRVLKPGGHLILTTPNVARLENVAKMIMGVNIYDPYSGYGPYGRHNREYNQHELSLLMEHEGFTSEVMYTADVHPSGVENFLSLSQLPDFSAARAASLGQYLFTRFRATGDEPSTRPSWLYRSYPPNELSE